jgi:hypothetical protein
MDRLCSLSGQRDCSSNEKQTKKQKVATMAWAAFQVLANRCIEWEKVEGMQYSFLRVGDLSACEAGSSLQEIKRTSALKQSM